MAKKKGTLLVVDDVPENMRILAEILQEEYIVKATTSGRKAITICEAGGIDLVLLDIMMPELDGFDVLRLLRSKPKTSGIPVIFVTSRDDMVDEAEGLRLGAVDYITKPVSGIITKARIANHLALHRYQKDLKSLLTKTLSGAVLLLTDLLSLSNPDMFSKASAMKILVHELVSRLELKNSWEYELAALLSQIGCVTLDPDLLRKLNSGGQLSEIEEEMYNKYYNVSAALLGKIPKFERIAQMIQNVNMGINRPLNPQSIHDQDPVEVGRRLLQVAFTYNKFLNKKMQPAAIIQILKEDEGTYDRLIVNVLEDLTTVVRKTRFEEKTLRIEELKLGMIVNEDIHTLSGQLLMSRGAEISSVILKKLTSFLEAEHIEDGVSVLIRK